MRLWGKSPVSPVAVAIESRTMKASTLIMATPVVNLSHESYPVLTAMVCSNDYTVCKATESCQVSTVHWSMNSDT